MLKFGKLTGPHFVEVAFLKWDHVWATLIFVVFTTETVVVVVVVEEEHQVLHPVRSHGPDDD